MVVNANVRLTALLTGLCLLGPATPAASAATDVPGQLIVTFADETGRGARAEAHRDAEAALTERIGPIDVDVVTVPAGGVEEALERYAADPTVERVEPDPVVRALGDPCAGAPCPLPDDPELPRQWGLQNDAGTLHRYPLLGDSDIDAPFAWQLGAGEASTTLAVLDSGVDLDHEDLTGQLRLSANFTRSETVDDRHGHGTHVAGIAAARAGNGVGVAGVAPGVSLISGKVLADDGNGSCSSISAGIVWAVDNGADVINLSVGGADGCSAQAAAVKRADDRGVLVVAAAGNGGSESASYPAAYPSVMAVAATDEQDALASFSNRGSWVDIAAPGAHVFSTQPNHESRTKARNYGSRSGTSMAAPHVAGAAALLWSLVGDLNGDGRRSDEVRARLEGYADAVPGAGRTLGAGRLNLCNAAAGERTACTLR